MAGITITGNNNMSALDPSTILNGTITTNNSTTLTITATNGTVYTLTGNFTGGSGSTFPTGGAITGWTSSATDGSAVNIVNLDLAVSKFDHDLHANNGSALLHNIFAGADNFHVQDGTGNDIISGYSGNDQFMMAANFTSTDSINGGAGYNTVYLNGDYSSGLTLNDDSLINIRDLSLRGNHNYNITTTDDAVAAGKTLLVDASQLTTGDALMFNGSAETTGRFDFQLGSVVDSTIIGGSGDNVFNGAGSGNNTLDGGAGNDKFIFGNGFDGTDTINGGGGYNTVYLSGDYSSGVTFGASSLVNIQRLVLEGNAGGDNYNVTLNAANVTSGDTLRIVGHNTDSSNDLTVDASATSGKLVFVGGVSTDTFTGGSGDNVFQTGSGVENLTGGGSSDRFVFSSVANSTGPTFDTIDSFNAMNDHFVLGTQITGIDAAVSTGSLSAATFNADMTADLGSTQLTANHAVLFTPNAGTYAGDTFLVVDSNGQAGYTAGQDIVVELNGATNLGSLGSHNFYYHDYAG